MPPYDWANGDTVDVLGGWYGFSTVEVGAILWNGCGIQGEKVSCITPGE